MRCKVKEDLERVMEKFGGRRNEDSNVIYTVVLKEVLSYIIEFK